MNRSAKKLTNVNIRKPLVCALLAAGVLFDLLLLGCRLPSTGESVWSSAALWGSGLGYTPMLCVAMIVLFMVHLVAAAVGIYLTLFKKSTPLFSFGIAFVLHILVLVMNITMQILGAAGIVWLTLALILSIVGAVYCIVYLLVNPSKRKSHSDQAGGDSLGRVGLLLGALGMVLPISLFFIPFCRYIVDGEVYMHIPISVLSSTSNFVTLVVFVCLFVLTSVSFVCFLKSIECYSSSDLRFVGMLRNSLFLNAVIAGGYFVTGVIYSTLRNARGWNYSTSSYLPFLISAVLLIAFAFWARKVGSVGLSESEKELKSVTIEFFIYGTLVSAVTVVSVLTDILRVNVTEPIGAEVVRLNGYSLLTRYNSLIGGFQLMAFLLIAILTVTVALFLASLVAMISRSKLFYKLTLAEVLSGSIASLLLGLFSKYYEVVQKLNEEAIRSWIGALLDLSGVEIQYKVTGQSFWWFLIVMAIVVVIFVRKPYTRGTSMENAVASEASVLPKKEAEARPEAKAPSLSVAEFDPCPAFTELDEKAMVRVQDQMHKDEPIFDSPTLPDLVRFVVDYARNSRLHLSYTAEDIAAFVAGLGATRLTILQGMSGTGKTSLPKIFTEAILGRCEIIEVESSWRDKNELLGYYNEFSHTYTPKKFTQALYKAKLDPNRITFIVLDEMNLSRIEYYFSDFLSLMENEADKREIKLLNIALYRTEGGKKYAYTGLTDGHTLKIPSNVWFIGTANRDESTFEISDKVYDRAHTMNFNKRAPKVTYRSDPIAQRYLSVETLIGLLEDAKQNGRFDLDSSPIVGEVETLLEPYNISFGNRVAGQIEDFVRIYTACFAPSEAVTQEALETILLSKVVSKLEFKSIDNKAALAAEFRRLKLDRCADFILKLNED